MCSTHEGADNVCTILEGKQGYSTAEHLRGIEVEEMIILIVA